MNPQLKPVGLSLARPPCGLRDVRLHDTSPAQNTNVLGSDYVCMTSAATRRTTESGLIGAVCRITVPAFGASARGVVGIDQYDPNTKSLRFVADKEA